MREKKRAIKKKQGRTHFFSIALFLFPHPQLPRACKRLDSLHVLYHRNLASQKNRWMDRRWTDRYFNNLNVIEFISSMASEAMHTET